MEKTKVRAAKWDNLRFFLILCVVVGHFYSAYSPEDEIVKGILLFVYSFHMPAFVFVSGIFSKKAIDAKRYDKVFSLLVLYLIVKYARWAMNAILTQRFRFSYTDIPDASWYAFALVVFYLFTMLIRKYDARYMMIFAIVVSCMSGYAKGLGTEFAVTRILTFYPFFLAGYYVKTGDILKITERNWVKVVSAGLLIGLAYIAFTKSEELYWLMKLFKGKNSYRALKDYADYGGLIRFSWFIVAAMMILAFIALTPFVKSIFTQWGSRTLQIYALHIPLVDLFFNKVEGVVWFENMSSGYRVLVVFVAAFLLTCLLSIKPIENVMNVIIYPKRRKE